MQPTIWAWRAAVALSWAQHVAPVPGGRLIVVRPIASDQLRIGDCIAYRVDGSDSRIIHRITRLVPAIRTKGDHRPCEDDVSVSPDDIEGRVVACIRCGKRIGVASGWWGHRRRAVPAMAGSARSVARGSLGQFARMLRAVIAPVAARWLDQPATVHFLPNHEAKSSGCSFGGRAVATFDQRARAWHVDWPLRLWIDPRRLPVPHRQLPDS